MNTQINEAVENLYKAFSGNPKPEKIEHCPCCFSDGEVETLLGNKLRDIPPREIEAYAFSVLGTIGDIVDFKFFLPRILEIYVTESMISFVDIEIIVQKFRKAGWANWPESEKQAIIDFFTAMYSNEINKSEPDGFAVDSWIFALCYTTANIVEYLELLKKPECESAFQEFLEVNLQFFTNNHLMNSFWEHDSPQIDSIKLWLRNDEVTVYLFSKYGMVVKHEC